MEYVGLGLIAVCVLIGLRCIREIWGRIRPIDYSKIPRPPKHEIDQFHFTVDEAVRAYKQDGGK